MPANVKDRLFMAVVIVVSVVAGMMLMQAIESYKNQEEVGAAEGGLAPARVQK